MKGGSVYNDQGHLGLQRLAERKEILTQDTTWVNLKDIMLSQISQAQKDKYCMILLECGTSSSQNQRDKKQHCSSQGLREAGDEELLFQGDGVSVC